MHWLLWSVVIITVLMTTTAWALWLERKLAARMGSRLGPTMVGRHGLLQPIADLLKLLQKEDILPEAADGALFNLAPILTAVFAIATVAVVPFGEGVIAADLDIGVLWVLAFGGLMVIPVWMAGWASNNKFALLGGMRAVAQAVSYEVPLVLASMVPVILAGSMSMTDIVHYQQQHSWIALWPTLPGLPAFLLFLLASLAESNRIPFDIPEAESELVAGVSTEYTGMKFGLFYMAEYIHTLVSSAIGAALFLGGWSGPFAPGLHWMLLKTLGLFVFIYVVRWTLLRFRQDQLMRLAWVWLVPMGLVLVFMAAVVVVWGGA